MIVFVLRVVIRFVFKLIRYNKIEINRVDFVIKRNMYFGNVYILLFYCFMYGCLVMFFYVFRKIIKKKKN